MALMLIFFFFLLHDRNFQVDSSVASYLSSVLPVLRMIGNKNMELERPTSHHGLCYSGRFDAAVTYKFVTI